MSSPTSTPRRTGTARSALQHRHFRVLFIGASMSNVGTWMQNFMLPAYLDVRTGSAAFVGLLVFAQLGPMLFGSVPAGVLADRVDRTRLILAMQASMMVLSVVLGGLARWSAPIWTIFAIQLGIGNNDEFVVRGTNANRYEIKRDDFTRDAACFHKVTDIKGAIQQDHNTVGKVT